MSPPVCHSSPCMRGSGCHLSPRELQDPQATLPLLVLTAGLMTGEWGVGGRRDVAQIAETAGGDP
jgi:hypothetical protein